MAPRLGLAALAGVAALMAGCGEQATEITLTLDADGKGGETSSSATVTCPGDDPAICDAVASLPDDAAAPVPPQTACTEIYGGPDVVAIEGTLRGEPVDVELTRANGCEIGRFDRFDGLLAALYPDYEPGASLRP